MLKIERANAYYIPIAELKEDDIERAHQRFTWRFYEDKACKRCEYLEDRHGENCDGCAAFKGAVQLSKVVTRNGEDYLSLPIGATEQVKKWANKVEDVEEVKFVSRFPEWKQWRRPITFTGELRDYQVEAVSVCYQKKRGVLKSPPRSGKTVVGTALICEVGCKTLILAHQREWLEGFRETFCGSETQKALTDAKPRQVAFCTSLEEFFTTDVCLATFQQFFSPAGKKLLQRVKDWFNIVMVDECHQTPAAETSRVLAQLNSQYKIGLSGTPDIRKDGKSVILMNLMGPIIYEAQFDALRPRIHTYATNQTFEIKGRHQAAWPHFVSKIEKDRERRQKIAKLVVRLAEKGHFVLLPLNRVVAVKQYVREINQEAEEVIAREFIGGAGPKHKALRKKLVTDARNYEFKVMVGNARLISTGLNIPRASVILQGLTPSSNLLQCEQRVKRVLTPFDGKPQPIIYLILDKGKQVQSMMRNEYYNCIVPKTNPLVDDVTAATLKEYFTKGGPATAADI